MDIKDAIGTIVSRIDLKPEEMHAVMRQIMTGGATPTQIGGFLTGMRAKGETVEELSAAAVVMRELAMRVKADPKNLVDTCGTGGDNRRLFNVSTAAAFVVAAAGGRVAKHGNRSMSSKSGSADLLEAMGVPLEMPPARVAESIEKVGIGFMFAPAHHPAARFAAAPRRELGTRTLFNLLGPLTNPANAPHQLLGVFAERWVEPLANVLKSLGSTHVLVVHSDDGLDEVSLAAPTQVSELKDGKVTNYRIQPEDFGIPRQPLDALEVDGPQASIAMVESALSGLPGPARDMLALNAGAAIYAADVTGTLKDGVVLAQKALADGAAKAKLAEFLEHSR
ncbi:MAG TPA: anthranilate phosphoribosyltransferase [Gammaproteobacteria bacterium]|jgi:anthranilate phosphoribosyltransferase|nr:anthranilate phosphoribosyltransferase [Gammaproteobacteria bacterium]